jgi:uncharacterized membrane protein
MSNKIPVRQLPFYIFLFCYSASIIFLAYKLNIWEDESYSLHTSSNNLSDVIRQSYNFEGQPPLYFLLLTIWRSINSELFFARLLSLIFIGSGAIYFYKLVRLVSGIESSRWLLVVFLLNPFTVWAALEIRLYSLAILLSTVLVYYFFRFYSENKNKDLYLFLFFSVLGLYTQYFIAFEIFALALSVLFFKGWSDFFRICLYLIPVALLFIPNLFLIFNQVEMIQELSKTKTEMAADVLRTPQTLVLGFEMTSINKIIPKIVRIFFLLISMYAYYLLHKRRHQLSPNFYKRINASLLVSVTIVLLYVLLVPIMNLGFQARYMAIMLPLFLLLFTLFKQYDLRFRNSIFIGLSLYYLLLLSMVYRIPIKRYDFKTLSGYVSRIKYPKEPVLLYSKVLFPPFSFYYTGQDSLIPLPSVKYDNNYYEENITDTSSLKYAIGKIYSPTRSYLLITGNIEGFRHPINMDQQMFDNCLQLNYNIVSDTSISGYPEKYALRIRRLEIKESPGSDGR